MAHENLMCEGKGKFAYSRSTTEKEDEIFYKDTDGHPKKGRLIRCPICGRGLMPDLKFHHDGGYVIALVPPHKVKGWWKKGKPRRKERSRGVRRR